jgi:hypothetical protein
MLWGEGDGKNFVHFTGKGGIFFVYNSPLGKFLVGLY